MPPGVTAGCPVHQSHLFWIRSWWALQASMLDRSLLSQRGKVKDAGVSVPIVLCVVFPPPPNIAVASPSMCCSPRPVGGVRLPRTGPDQQHLRTGGITRTSGFQTTSQGPPGAKTEGQRAVSRWGGDSLGLLASPRLHPENSSFLPYGGH